MSLQNSIRLAVCLLLFLISTCADPRPDPDPSWPNILLISLDTLRADHVGAYGYTRPTTPFLDELARTGILFENAFVNTHGTAPSHATILSSLYQETHRVGFNPANSLASSLVVPNQIVMLQEHLQQIGYRTVGITDGGYVSRNFGFNQGFDYFQDNTRSVRAGTRELLETIRRNLDQNRPIFAFYHTYEIHSPYQAPAKYRGMFGEFQGRLEPLSEELLPLQTDASSLEPEDFEALIAAYDEEVRYTDDTLRQTFQELRKLGFLENALIVITSDHGEEFGDHGGLLHRDILYDEVLRVPLILWGSRITKPSVYMGLASSIDIAPTILGQSGIRELRTSFEGRDLLASSEENWPVFSQYGSYHYSLRTSRWKLIFSPGPGHTQLYDLSVDAREQNDLSVEQPQRVEELLAVLNTWKSGRVPVGQSRTAPEISEELLRQLRSLGYVQ